MNKSKKPKRKARARAKIVMRSILSENAGLSRGIFKQKKEESHLFLREYYCSGPSL
jgi:hypothetical protein